MDKIIKAFAVIFMLTSIYTSWVTYNQQQQIVKLQQTVTDMQKVKHNTTNNSSDWDDLVRISNNGHLSSDKPNKESYKEHIKNNTKSYIGNSHTHVLHKDGCSYVNRMSASNIVNFDNVNDAFNKGYRSCSKCNP